MKCKRCGLQQIRYPIWKGQEEGEPFSFDKIIWINLFKVELGSVLFFVSVVLLLYGMHSIKEQVQPILDNPIPYAVNMSFLDAHCIQPCIINRSAVTAPQIEPNITLVI